MPKLHLCASRATPGAFKDLPHALAATADGRTERAALF